MTQRILIVGSGAREHAIAAACDRSPQSPQLFCFGSARNPGIAALVIGYKVGDITSPESVVAYARAQEVTLAIIGPEAPLAAGVTDALIAAGIAVVGPTQALAQIESSKSFTRALLAQHDIPGNPKFARFEPHQLDRAEAFLLTLPMQHVIKDDGLAGGKGVKVCGDHLHSHEDSIAFCRELAARSHPFVIEEKFEGEEFSLLSFTDGTTLRHMPVVQDHKRAFNGDTGPNTGGMGSYTAPNHSLPFLTAQDIAEAEAINSSVVAALRVTCGAPYRGVLYGGFMATRDGVRLIEYNARFGDPECLNLLTLLETDFVAICEAIVRGTLDTLDVRFHPQASVCKYVVPEGYPDAPRIGDAVTLPRSIPNVLVYMGAVDVAEDGLIATGSRTLGIVGVAETVAAAESLAEQSAQQVPGPFTHRSDIGTAASLRKRTSHMTSLRASPPLR